MEQQLKKTLNPKTNTYKIREASRQRREQEKQELSQAILSVSAELFLEQGYEHFSLRQVAERLGYATGTIYLYYKDKNEILFRLVVEGFNFFGQQLRGCLHDNMTPAECLQALGRTYIDFGLQNKAVYQLMFVQRPDFIMSIYRESPQPIGIETLELFRVEVQKAMQAGLLRQGDVISTTDALWALLHGCVTLTSAMASFDEDRRNRTIETTLEILVSGIHL